MIFWRLPALVCALAFFVLVSLASMRKRGSSLAPGIILRVGEVLKALAKRTAVPSNALHFTGAPWRYAVGDGGGLMPLLLCFCYAFAASSKILKELL